MNILIRQKLKEEWENEHPGEKWTGVGSGFNMTDMRSGCSDLDNIVEIKTFFSELNASGELAESIYAQANDIDINKENMDVKTGLSDPVQQEEINNNNSFPYWTLVASVLAAIGVGAAVMVISHRKKADTKNCGRPE